MKNEKVILIGLNDDYYTHYYLTKNIELIEAYKINDFNIDDITFTNEKEAKKYLNKILKSYKYNIDSYSIEKKKDYLNEFNESDIDKDALLEAVETGDIDYRDLPSDLADVMDEIDDKEMDL